MANFESSIDGVAGNVPHSARSSPSVLEINGQRCAKSAKYPLNANANQSTRAQAGYGVETALRWSNVLILPESGHDARIFAPDVTAVSATPVAAWHCQKLPALLLAAQAITHGSIPTTVQRLHRPLGDRLQAPLESLAQLGGLQSFGLAPLGHRFRRRPGRDQSGRPRRRRHPSNDSCVRVLQPVCGAPGLSHRRCRTSNDRGRSGYSTAPKLPMVPPWHRSRGRISSAWSRRDFGNAGLR